MIPSNKLIFYLFAAAGFLLLTNVVYIVYGSHAGNGYLYTGADPYAAADKLVYLSMIEQGREGIVFMKNLHTVLPQKGLLLSPHWYGIGQTAALLGISNVASYQVYRVLFTVFFIMLLYFVLQKLFRSTRETILAALLVFFSGGVGWFLLLKFPQILTSTVSQYKFLHAPIDLYVTEGNTLLNFNQAPLFSLSQLMLLGIFVAFVYNRKEARPLFDMLIGFLVLLLGIMHPYDMPIIFAVLGTWALWSLWQEHSWKSVLRLFYPLCGGALALAWTGYTLIADPVLSGWLKQNLVYSPPIQNYILGYGLLIPLWAVGLVYLYRNKRDNPWWALIATWSVVIWLLLYLPTTINRRFVNGWHIALALVAAQGLVVIYRACRRTWLKAAVLAVSMLFLMSSLGLFLFISVFFSPAAYTYGYYYITPDEQRVIHYLETASTRSDNLYVSDAKTGFAITSQINRAIFRGHDHQTPEYHLKQQEVDWFNADIQGVNALVRREHFLHTNGIAYVILNTARLENPAPWLGDASFAPVVFTTDTLTVYKVR